MKNKASENIVEKVEEAGNRSIFHCFPQHVFSTSVNGNFIDQASFNFLSAKCFQFEQIHVYIVQ